MVKLAFNSKKPAIKYSLEAKMILYLILLLSILMIVTTYLGIKRESNGILKQMQLDGIALAKSYALSTENALMLKAGLGRVTGEASRTKGIKYLKIIDQNCHIIGHTDVTLIGRRETDPLYRRALATPITAVDKGKQPLTLIDRGRLGEATFRVVIPLVILNAVVGALEIGLDMAGIAEAVRDTNLQSLLVSLAAFFFGGVGIWFFARTLTRPVRNLVVAAEQIANGDLEQEIRVSSRDEIGLLSSAFNHMTQRLREYTGNLLQSNAQLEADAALIAKLRNYTENVLNSITPGVLTLDLERTIITINNSGNSILNLTAETVIGRKIEAVFPPDHPLRPCLDRMYSAGESFQGSEINLASGPNELLLTVNGTFLYEPPAQLVGIVVTFENITEIRQWQRRINEAEKLAAMGGLAAGIAHEVRNPLGSIKTCAQFLEDKLPPNDPNYKFSQLIIRETERLNLLIERLLDFTKPGDQDYEYQNLHEILDNVLALAALKAQDLHLELIKDFDCRIPPLLLNAKRLQQAFLNLILNACDAMSAGGRLTVLTALDGVNETVRVEIADTGAGIPPDQIDKIFNPFFTTKSKGTGLGLAIVRQIIMEHNGKVSIQSSNGNGTVFLIQLPLVINPDFSANTANFIC